MPQYPLRRLTAHKMIGGVCAGLAVHFGIHVTVVRLLWLLVTLASAGLGIIAYLVLWAKLPEG